MQLGLSWFSRKVENKLIFFVSFPFGRKNNNILRLGTILNNEANVLKSFVQIFGMAKYLFSRNSARFSV